MISSLGKGVKSFNYNGKKASAVWCQGKKVWPSVSEPELFGDKLYLTVSIPDNNHYVRLGPTFSPMGRVVVNWGDGSKNEEFTAFGDGPVHTYNTSGTYTITVCGNVSCAGANLHSQIDLMYLLTGIDIDGSSPIKSIGQWGFSGFTSLSSIPQGLLDNCVNDVDFSYCFQDTNISWGMPSNLFSKCTSAQTFRGCFRNASVSYIPGNIFDGCYNATDFTECFYANFSLMEIPYELFLNLLDIRDLTSCFGECSQLTEIPDGLFGNNRLIESFGGCFYNCGNLQSIPEKLFDNCLYVTDFYQTFYNCRSITSKLPELWKTHPSASGYQCFYGCTQAPNYQEALEAGWA